VPPRLNHTVIAYALAMETRPPCSSILHPSCAGSVFLGAGSRIVCVSFFHKAVVPRLHRVLRLHRIAALEDVRRYPPL
jgi:hypothetical protein